MLLEEIDFTTLSNESREDRWGRGDAIYDRELYFDGINGLWIKIWAPGYIRNLKLCRGSEYALLQSDGANNVLHGVDIGFFTSENSLALNDYIYDKDGCVRGYTTEHGVLLEEIPFEFTRVNAERMFRLGWVMSDYCTMNLVSVRGELSFIDYDTYFTSLADLDPSFEAEFGCLRPHIDPLFRSMVLDAVKQRQ